MITGLPFVVQKHNRYWVHCAFVVFQLAATVAAFWNFWGLREVEWTFPSFVVALMSPAAIYYNACVLVPENASEVQSWRDYYYSVRQRYFVGVLCWFVIIVAVSLVVLFIPLLHPMRIFNVLMILAALSGLLSENPRVHGAIAVFYLALLTFLMTAVASRPGLPIE